MHKTPARIFIAVQLAIILSGHFVALALTNDLAQLLTTNRTGTYSLDPAWVGKCSQTFASGFFAARTNGSTQEIADGDLYFDLFAYYNKPSAFTTESRLIGKRFKDATYGNVYVSRESFPTDAQLAQARTLNSLTNLLGRPRGPRDGWGSLDAMHSQAGWQHFRFKDENTLETLSVACHTISTNDQLVEYIESLRIRRGTASRARQ